MTFVVLGETVLRRWYDLRPNFQRRLPIFETGLIDLPQAEKASARRAEIIRCGQRAAVAGDGAAERPPGGRSQIFFLFELADLTRNAGPVQYQVDHLYFVQPFQVN